MRIEQHIRIKTNQYLRQAFIKDKCEVCSKTDDLVLHHVKPFAQILEDCLDCLGYEYRKYKDQYSKIELDNITNWMLGVQLRIKYLTLCPKCHLDIHQKSGGFFKTNNKFDEYVELQRMKKLQENAIKEEELKSILMPYLESIVGERLYNKEDKCELIDVISAKVNSKTQRSHSKLNKKLEKLGIGYVILPKKSNNKRYWVVEKVPIE